VAVVVVLVVGFPAAARADWLFSPFLGSTFAGATTLPVDQGASAAHMILGGSAGLWSRGLFGVEADFAFAPSFFQDDNTTGIITSSNVVTFAMDLVVAAPVSVTRESLRPYVVGGLGWMHASVEEGFFLFPEIFGRARNSVGMNVGGGAIGFLTPNTGVRFDLRHFRSLERDDNELTGERRSLLSYWRATVGVVIRR
jgi:hypothetical protein